MANGFINDNFSAIGTVTAGTTSYATTFDTNVAAAGVTLEGTTLAADGTNSNIDITITPKGTGSVVMSKVDINGGTINGITDIEVADGGTGVSTLTDHGVLLGNGALEIIATAEGATGKVLTGVTGGSPTWQDPASSGDVVGPATATDNALARFDTATGELLQNSDAILTDGGDLTIAGTILAAKFDTNVAAAGLEMAGTTISADGSDVNIDVTVTPKGSGSVVISKATISAGTITGITDLLVADGGTGAGTFTDHGVILGNATGALTATAEGTTGQVLTGVTGGAPVWAAVGVSVGGWTLIEEKTVTSDVTTLEFTTNVTGYDTYCFVFHFLRANTYPIYVVFSDDEGSTWKTGASDYIDTTGSAASRIYIGTTNEWDSYGFCGRMYLYQSPDSYRMALQSNLQSRGTLHAKAGVIEVALNNNVNGVAFIRDNGYIRSGVVALYGINS